MFRTGLNKSERLNVILAELSFSSFLTLLNSVAVFRRFEISLFHSPMIFSYWHSKVSLVLLMLMKLRIKDKLLFQCILQLVFGNKKLITKKYS